MGCLTGVIQLKGCSVTEVQGAVYSLNSLPGISLKTFESVANSEQQNYIGVWNAINERAEAMIKDSIISHLSTRYKLKRVQRTLDTANQTQTSIISDRKFKGIYISTNYSLVDEYKCSPFQTTSIDKIRFWCDDNTILDEVEIQFCNFLTKEVLFSVTKVMNTLDLGWNEISINKSFNCPSLIIGFNQALDSVQYSDAKLNQWYNDYCSFCYGGSACGQLRGFISTTDSVNGTLTLNDVIVGLQVVTAIGCSFDAAICTNRLLFASSMWYLLGSELMTEIMFSERINFMTTVKREEASELKALYDVKYEDSLKNALNGLQFDCDCCIECDSQVQQFTALP